MKLKKTILFLLLLFLTILTFPIYSPLKTETNQFNEMEKFPIQSAVLQNYTMIEDAPYNWIDASDGINLASTLGDDGSIVQYLPFNFTYYNETFSTVYVSSNGYLSFTDITPTDPSNDPIPSSDTDNTYLIAPFWDDLDPPDGGNVYVNNYSSYWVFECQNITHWGGGNNYLIGTFEVILFDNGDIVFNYEWINRTNTDGSGYTCGLNLGLNMSYYNSYQFLTEKVSDFSLLFTYLPIDAPRLYLGSVSPKIGYNSSSNFKFSVNYLDLQNNPPNYVNVTINSTTYSMSKQDSLDNNYMNGCWYEYETILEDIGTYTYFFNCSDGTYTDGDGPYIGPTVKEINIINYTMIADAPYNWIDASDGINLTSTLGDDDSTVQYLPFNFTYYNETFSTVYVSSNGYLSFTDITPTDPSNDPIPSSDTDNTYLIAPFWDDLDPPDGGNVYVNNYSSYWVFECQNITHWGGGNNYLIGTFEVILFDNGDIVFNYEWINRTNTDSSNYTCGLNLGLEFDDPSLEYYNEYNGIIAPPPFETFSILFTHPPQNPSIIINNGDTTTNSSLVTLTLSAINADEMCFRNGTDGAWTAWEPYNITKQIELAGSINNTIYSISAKFRNLGGESGVVSDTILFLTKDDDNGGRRIPGYPLYLLLIFFTAITAIIVKKKYTKLQ
ncbi:MAG: hypothetical protein ACFFCM_14565 [Promethearchaeota archaeon]